MNSPKRAVPIVMAPTMKAPTPKTTAAPVSASLPPINLYSALDLLSLNKVLQMAAHA